MRSGQGPPAAAEASHRNLERTELVETLAVVLFLLLAFLSLEGLNLPWGSFGAVESGWIAFCAAPCPSSVSWRTPRSWSALPRR